MKVELSFPLLVDAIERGKPVSAVSGIGYRENGKVAFTPPTTPLKDLDNVPCPRRGLVEQYRSDYFFRFWDNIYSIETTRGCPYNCKFCSVWRFFGGKVRFKSPERVVGEIEALPLDLRLPRGRGR